MTTRNQNGEGCGLSAHILPSSANLVGACMCAVPLVKLLPRSGWSEWIDEVLLVASLFFVASAALSYASIRWQRYAERRERSAEALFMTGMGFVFIALLGLALSMA